MTKLNFVSLQADGTHLVLSDDAGTTYHLPITPELRQAVRRPMQSPKPNPAPSDGTLRPREIQEMLRAGVSVSDIAAEGKVSEDYVQRFEGPIIAEREWAIQVARECTVGHELGAPTLGEIVVDRLAERGVDTDSLSWNAFRESREPWNVTVEFDAGGKTRTARWRLDMASRSVRALEDEARWLSETDSSSPRARRHVRSFEPDEPPAPSPEETEEPAGATESLLDHLAKNRGRRPEPSPFGDVDELSDPLFGAGDDIPAAHPSRPEEAHDAVVLSFPEREVSEPREDELNIEVERAPKQEKPKRSKKSGRRSVPSWDEIVFGGKSDD
ncbi:hypothetical protein BSZ39_01485 [Bowdeniella nasicola]|uniref:DUF3071 domain-containing protein n=1 Tax=Bowdeniella nasicola TaxID=208480 RepID=A0A1Q5Q518_9ACTO|nr:septation protein SepH [Bowdeniella nasicola]OKL54881.1 hypothetical protein BSZ39_01485 [Bowdeniella nasicola]